MFVLAILLAYFISSYITRNIKAVTDKMRQTSLDKRNEKIILKNASVEIFTLVNAYNSMIDELNSTNRYYEFYCISIFKLCKNANSKM